MKKEILIIVYILVTIFPISAQLLNFEYKFDHEILAAMSDSNGVYYVNNRKVGFLDQNLRERMITNIPRNGTKVFNSGKFFKKPNNNWILILYNALSVNTPILGLFHTIEFKDGQIVENKHEVPGTGGVYVTDIEFANDDTFIAIGLYNNIPYKIIMDKDLESNISVLKTELVSITDAKDGYFEVSKNSISHIDALGNENQVFSENVNIINTFYNIKLERLDILTKTSLYSIYMDSISINKQIEIDIPINSLSKLSSNNNDYYVLTTIDSTSTIHKINDTLVLAYNEECSSYRFHDIKCSDHRILLKGNNSIIKSTGYAANWKLDRPNLQIISGNLEYVKTEHNAETKFYNHHYTYKIRIKNQGSKIIDHFEFLALHENFNFFYPFKDYTFYEKPEISIVPGEEIEFEGSFIIQIYINRLLEGLLIEVRQSDRMLNDNCSIKKWIPVSTTENNDIGSFEFNIYPNPSSNLININSLDEIDYKIVDLNGKTICTGQINNGTTSINSSDWLSGQYFIYLSNKIDSIITESILIQH